MTDYFFTGIVLRDLVVTTSSTFTGTTPMPLECANMTTPTYNVTTPGANGEYLCKHGR